MIILTKTNAQRILDSAKIQYTPLEYTYSDDDLSGVTIAKSIGLNPDIVFKTLTARGSKGGIFVFCIPCNMELDLKKCAKVCGEKKIDLLPVKELLSVTGYIRGGCSPIGMKKAFPSFIDETALLWDKITVSAGVKGCQLLLNPNDLISLCNMQVCDLTL